MAHEVSSDCKKLEKQVLKCFARKTLKHANNYYGIHYEHAQKEVFKRNITFLNQPRLIACAQFSFNFVSSGRYVWF